MSVSLIGETLMLYSKPITKLHIYGIRDEARPYLGEGGDNKTIDCNIKFYFLGRSDESTSKELSM